MKMTLTHSTTETIIAAEDRKSSPAPSMGQKTETKAILKAKPKPNEAESAAEPDAIRGSSSVARTELKCISV